MKKRILSNKTALSLKFLFGVFLLPFCSCGGGNKTENKPGENTINQPPFKPDQPPFKPDQPPFKPDQPPFKPDQPPFKPDQPPFKPDQPSFNPDQTPPNTFFSNTNEYSVINNKNKNIKVSFFKSRYNKDTITTNHVMQNAGNISWNNFGGGMCKEVGGILHPKNVTTKIMAEGVYVDTKIDNDLTANKFSLPDVSDGFKQGSLNTHKIGCILRRFQTGDVDRCLLYEVGPDFSGFSSSNPKDISNFTNDLLYANDQYFEKVEEASKAKLFKDQSIIMYSGVSNSIFATGLPVFDLKGYRPNLADILNFLSLCKYIDTAEYFTGKFALSTYNNHGEKKSMFDILNLMKDKDDFLKIQASVLSNYDTNPNLKTDLEKMFQQAKKVMDKIAKK